MNTIHPAIIWDIERRRRELEVDNRLPLYIPMPGPEPKAPAETEYVIEF